MRIIEVLIVLAIIFSCAFLLLHKEYKQPTVQNDCLRISDKQALNIVSALPEVKDFLLKMKQASQPTVMRIVHQGNNLIVQVAENHPYHLATFNWYKLDACTGKVKS